MFSQEIITYIHYEYVVNDIYNIYKLQLSSAILPGSQ